MRSVAIQIGANSRDPGGPGPVYTNGSFDYVPAPEPDPSVSGPTYRDLGLVRVRPAGVGDVVATMNPEFPNLATGTRYTYACGSSETAHRIRELEEGDILFFYARLSYAGEKMPTMPRIDEEYGYYLVGQFTLAHDPWAVTGPWNIPRTVWQAFAGNAHRRRDSFNANVLVLGDAVHSGLYERVLPLDGPHLEPTECLPIDVGDEISSRAWGERPITFDSSVTERLLRLTAGGRPTMPAH